jgi:hypothetical protein
MHTVALLEKAIAIAGSLGYQVRQEWLDGAGGGHCQLGGRKWIFLDLSQDAAEHLDRIIEALRSEPEWLAAVDSQAPELASLLRRRRAA